MPNKDFVSRQWLIDEYNHRHKGPPGGALKMIEEAPAADVEPRQRWIPVTERLPEVGEDVLIYAVGKADDFSSVIAITDRMIFRLFPSSEGVETWSSPWQYFMTNYEITHWMLLPDPPKMDKEA